VAVQDSPSPYKFLDPYELEDAYLFFGRELETKILLADILTTRLVVLFAKTGTGKTSLINAGVRPALHERGYRTFFVRVQENPVRSARAAIEEQLEQPLEGGEEAFVEQLRSLAEVQPMVLFFDQFEEFFQYAAKKRDAAEAREFVARVADLYEDESSGMHFVFSMREEFLAEMEIFRDDIPTIFGSDSNLRLRWFSPEQAESAIVQPAAAFETTVEPDLLATVVRDLTAIGLALPGTNSATPIEPAQLQIVCDTIWRERTNGRLKLEHYLALGDPARGDNTAQQILDQRLVEEFEQLQTKRELELLWRLLPELHTTRGTKWVRGVQELAGSIDADEGELRALLDRLHRSGFVDVVARETTEFVELVHDYLAEPRRVETLRRAVRTIWPRRVLSQAVRAFGGDASTLPEDGLADVLEALDELKLSSLEGEVLLRSTLHDATDLERVLPASARSGADTWGILEERLEHADELEAGLVIETLARRVEPQAVGLLERALAGDEETAQRVVVVLGGVETTLSVELLRKAVAQERLRVQGQEALARLASTWGAPAVAQQAADALGEALSGAEVSPEVEEALLGLASSRHVAVRARTLPLLAKVEQVRAAQILGRFLADDELGATARSALLELRESSSPEVAAAAREALGEPSPPAPSERPVPSWKPRPEPREGRGSLEAVPSGRKAGSAELGHHLQSVVTALLRGRVVPFVGAGANVMTRPDAASWELGRFLPTGYELAHHLAQRSYYPSGEESGLARVAEFVALTAGTGALYDELRSIFAADYPVTPLHRFLAGLPRQLASLGSTSPFQLILTANWDDSLERAFDAEGEPYDLLVYAAEGDEAGSFWHRPPGGTPRLIARPSEYGGLSLSIRTVIVKLHGSVNRDDERLDSYVVTEDDFVKYLARSDLSTSLPAVLMAPLLRSSFLFLGYTLRDWTLRTNLQRIWGEQRLRTKSWAVLRDPSPVDQLFWQARGVDVLDVSLAEYVERLRDPLEQGGVRS
jgi:Novel STAND NTPase 1/SIR2-like domain